MKKLLTLALAGVALAAFTGLVAAATINSTRSNTFRVTYDTTVVSPAQAAALLAELEKLGPADEAKQKMWLAANFKRLGIQADRIKKIVVLPASNTRKTITIILLKNPADEAAAIAVSDPGSPADDYKPKK